MRGVLSNILALLEERGTLSVLEISQIVEVESSALHPMLELLERKEKIQKVELPCKSGCAGGCETSDHMLFYKKC
jgi:predicted transcriptional regulator